jgi:predicted RecA/RadA family phage recombinase
MSAKFIQIGHAVEFTPTTDIFPGTVVAHGNLVGVVSHPIPANHSGSLQLVGVFEVPRVSGGLIPFGSKAYWDIANVRATTDAASGANPYMGKVIKDSADGQTTVLVRLEQ